MVRQRSDRLITIAILVMLALALIQGAWLGYTFVVKPKLQASADLPLPDNVTDLRGQPLPSLAGLTPVEGYSLEAELQKPVTIVAFLLTTCPACNDAKPTLEALEQENPESIGFIGIFAESDGAVQNYDATYPRFLDPSRDVFDNFGAASVPMILVAQEGVVIHQTVGWSPEVGRRLRIAISGGRS